MYQRNKQDPMKPLVTQAIIDYREDSNNIGAGDSILRYAKRGLVGVSPEVDPQVFVDWYPLNQGFVILRLAKQGKLFYRENVKE